MRDILNTVEGYNEIKIFNIDAILEELEDKKNFNMMKKLEFKIILKPM